MTDKATLSDADILKIVAEERRQAVGFDNDDELSAQREKALNYIKGEMPDVPSMPNRSKAVDTAVADALYTVMPDLIEIFVGGDDVATFQATGPDDEEQAKQETAFVLHTIFDQDAGFLLFYTMMWDALSAKIGVGKSWYEEHEETDEQRVEGIDPVALPVVQAMAEANGAVVQVDGDALIVRTTKPVGCQRNLAVPPEDFAFAGDTVALRDTTYCSMRSRVRAQKLIEDGYDADLVDKLPAFARSDDGIEQARDTAGESDQQPTGATNALRTVEIREHYVRVDVNGDGKTELLRVVTNSDETVLLEKEEVELIPFAVITPYIVTHRLLGVSLADLLLETQRIKTALLRMLLDSGYFALNQRLEVATAPGRANQFTVSDLLRNEPGVPIRSTDGASVRPISSGGLNFDVTGALEYVSSGAEQKTGIVRNAQGLNPDTLHDTADGARQLIAAAQKRVRMIARIFAETGFKDLFLNVHQILRKHGRETTTYLGGEWSKIDPSKWPARKAVKVEIGVGSGGREHDLMAGQQLGQMLQNAVAAQGGLDGPLTNPKALVAYAKRQTARLGFKNEEQYWSDPEAFAQAKAQQPPPPDPKALEAQAKAQLAQQESEAKHALAQQDSQNRAALAIQELEARLRLDGERQARELDLKERTIAAEIDLKERQLAAELDLKERQMQTEAQMRAAGMVAGAMGSANIGSDVGIGGNPG